MNLTRCAMAKIWTSVRLEEKQITQLDDIVHRSGIGDRSDHIRKAIDDYIQTWKPDVIATTIERATQPVPA